jgi:endonuclease/exonuclease/phosphatase family metal-dependent hydrolase
VILLSCNIRYAGAEDGQNSWPHRKDLCLQVLQAPQPDIVCFQELWYEQCAEVQAAFPGYAWYGLVDEPAGRNPTNAIFYQREKFQFISAGGYWLSKTPHVPGSLSWQSACTRLANWVRLVQLDSGKEFRVINTHLDHISQIAREHQAQLINEDAAAYPVDYPQVLAGDMNSDPLNPAVGVLDQGGWRDTYEAVHGMRDPGFTFHEFLGANYHSTDLGKIDWIFTRGKTRATGAEIIRECPGGRCPSDHYFVMAEIELD